MDNGKFKKEIRTTLDKLTSKLDDIQRSYENNGKKILSIIDKKVGFNYDNSFFKYYAFFSKNTSAYQDYIEKINFENQKNEIIFQMLTIFQKYIEEYNFFKYKMQTFELKKIDSSTVIQKLNEIDSQNKNIIKILVTRFSREYNNYLTILEEIKESKKVIKKKISTILHIVYRSKNYIYEPDFDLIPKITIDKLRNGDIILFDEKTVKPTIVNNILKNWTKSSIIHSGIIYSTKTVDNSLPLIFQANGTNTKKTHIDPFEFGENERYLVMRHRKKISSVGIEKMKKSVEYYRNIEFSDLKLITLGLNDTLEKIWGNIPFITKGDNIYMGNSVFCSEVIVRLYNEIEIYIGYQEDPAMTSPIDIFNSFELEIVGYFEK